MRFKQSMSAAVMVTYCLLGSNYLHAQERPPEWAKERERALAASLWGKGGDRVKVLADLEGENAVWLEVDRAAVPLGKALHRLLYTFDLGDLFQMSLRIDSVKAYGGASVYWGDESFMQSSALELANPPNVLGITIFVDPDLAQSASLNTWTYILGHELAHYSLNHKEQCNPPDSRHCKVREHAADELGFQLALQTGSFSVEECIEEISQWGEEVSATHGSWVERARRLQKLWTSTEER